MPCGVRAVFLRQAFEVFKGAAEEAPPGRACRGLKSQKIAGAAAEIFARKNLNNDCASKTTLLRPRPSFAVRLLQER